MRQRLGETPWAIVGVSEVFLSHEVQLGAGVHLPLRVGRAGRGGAAAVSEPQDGVPDALRRGSSSRLPISKQGEVLGLGFLGRPSVRLVFVELHRLGEGDTLPVPSDGGGGGGGLKTGLCVRKGKGKET